MEIIYDSKIQKYFDNKTLLIKKVGLDNARSIKRRIDQIKASNNFQSYLDLRLGNPHRLKETRSDEYAVNITGNIRMILNPLTKGHTKADLSNCEKVIIKGVEDYHVKPIKKYLP